MDYQNQNQIVEIEPKGFVLNARIIRGTAWDQRMQLLGNDDVPVDLTGYTGKMTLRSATTGDAELVLEDGDGITIGTTNGYVDVTITTAQTTALAKGRYNFNLDIAAPGGEAEPLARGVLTLLDNTNIPDPE